MVYHPLYYDQSGSTRANLCAEVIITQQEENIRWILSSAISLLARQPNLNSIDY